MAVMAQTRSVSPLQRAPNSNARWEPLGRRACQLLTTEISFISNPEFSARQSLAADGTVETALHSADQAKHSADQAKHSPAQSPAHLDRICETELLTAQQEIALFREMNYLKFRANVLRSRLTLEQIDPESVETIESMLAKAQAIRNHIVQANLRLVMSIARKFANPRESFDDMFSDGTITLMQTVEKFDYSRGFRFSSYAYRSILRGVYHSFTSARNEQARHVRDAEQWAFEQEVESPSSLSDQAWDDLRMLTASMLNQLDRRERLIIRSRYALGVHRKVRTLQALANRLGVSKERVRQLEKRALGKLSAMAADLDLVDHCSFRKL